MLCDWRFMSYQNNESLIDSQPLFLAFLKQVQWNCRATPSLDLAYGTYCNQNCWVQGCFSHCCDEIPDRHWQSRAYFDSQIEGTDPHLHSQKQRIQRAMLVMCWDQSLLFIWFRTPAYGMLSSTFRVDLLSLINLNKKVSHKHVQRLNSWFSILAS